MNKRRVNFFSSIFLLVVVFLFFYITYTRYNDQYSDTHPKVLGAYTGPVVFTSFGTDNKNAGSTFHTVYKYFTVSPDGKGLHIGWSSLEDPKPNNFYTSIGVSVSKVASVNRVTGKEYYMYNCKGPSFGQIIKTQSQQGSFDCLKGPGTYRISIASSKRQWSMEVSEVK